MDPTRDLQPTGVRGLDVDQRVFLHRVSWRQYAAMLAMRGERGGVRIAYLDGELELMSPCWSHESLKKTLGRLVQAWSEEVEVGLNGAGSWTLRSAPTESGVEPDECYVIGDRRPKVPDFAIEVMWTPGGLDKLEIYRGLGVKEVWLWRKGEIEIHVLRGKAYQLKKRSALLPQLDFRLLERFLRDPNQARAVRAYRAALRAH